MPTRQRFAAVTAKTAIRPAEKRGGFGENWLAGESKTSLRLTGSLVGWDATLRTCAALSQKRLH